MDRIGCLDEEAALALTTLQKNLLRGEGFFDGENVGRRAF